MRLSPEAISEFKRIYAEECGEALSDDEANARGLELLRLFDLLMRADGGGTGVGDAKPFRPVDVPRGTGTMKYPTKKEPSI